ncbi:MAG TPA: FMN-binding protein [Anaeromyxobacteraceae bacterium]|nr:FMN-binding protein [Anaeromyxobacteraceae bacterium]
MVHSAILVALLAAGPAAAGGPAAGADQQLVRQLFPEADAVEPRDVLLTDAMVARIEQLARARVRERLVTFYTARKGGAVAGYAVIQAHVVRTKRETLLLGFEPDGRIRRISILAFLEPAEYRPPERWLAQFGGKGSSDRLAVGDDIAPITGATLSARGIAEQARWLLAALREAREVRP